MTRGKMDPTTFRRTTFDVNVGRDYSVFSSALSEEEAIKVLLDECVSNNHRTLDFCRLIDELFKSATNNCAMIRRFALGEKKYSWGRLNELKSFADSCDLFTDDFFQALGSVLCQQVSMLEKLERQMQKLDNKMKSLNSRKKLFKAIFISAVAVVLIGSVTAAAMVAPPVATALTALASVPFGSAGKWVNSLWKKKLQAVKDQQDSVKAISSQTVLVKNCLDEIKVLVNKIKIHKVFPADFSVQDVKSKVETLTRNVEDLKKMLIVAAEILERCKWYSICILGLLGYSIFVNALSVIFPDWLDAALGKCQAVTCEEAPRETT